MTNTIITMVMLVLTIMTLLVFARKSTTGKNNLFTLILIGLVAVAAAGYNITRPHFSVLVAMVLGVATLFHLLRWRQLKLIKAGTIPQTCAKKDLHIALNVTICCFLIIFGVLQMSVHVMWAWIAIALGAGQLVAFIWWNVKQI